MNIPYAIPVSLDTQSTGSKTWSENEVSIVHGGNKYFEKLITLINAATTSIHLQTYIYDDDQTGHLVAEALKSAARRNVAVYLLTDGYASQRMSRKFISSLRQAGIHFRYFEPLFKSQHFYFGRRLHHKLFVADACHALVGGLNIADRYNDLPGKEAWLDYSLYVRGEAARKICLICRETWNNFLLRHGESGCVPGPLELKSGKETSLVRISQNDWMRHKNEISATYIHMLRDAKSHVLIMCSYFIPGKVMRRLLSNATKRGVRIKIITSGPSDVLLAKYAERWLYDWLLRNKIELYEYRPTVLHAKVAVCDSKWLTVGSYNVNDVSAYASIELNLDVVSPTLAPMLEEEMENIINRDCVAITQKQHRQSKNIFKQFSRWMAYQLYSGIFNLLTFYFKQSKL